MRKELSRRPLLLAAVSLALGLTLIREPLLAVIVIGLLVAADGSGQRLMVIGLVALGVWRSPPLVHAIVERALVQGVGRVVTVPRIAGDGQASIVEIEGTRYPLFTAADVPIGYGDRVRVVAIAKPPKEGTERYFASKGVAAILDPQEIVTLEQGPVVLRWGQAWRDSFRAVTERSLSSEAKATANALCFNVESGLEPGLMDDLRRTGTVHIISASGLHVGIFAFFLQVVLSRLPFDRRYQLAILLFVLVLYMGAAGMRPPVVRAVIMTAAILAGYLFRREPDLLSSLGLATFIYLQWDPWSVLDLGLHLSFIAILGLGLFVRFDSSGATFLERVRTRAVQCARTSLVASLASAPVVAWSFGYVSVIAVFANLIIAPLVGVVVPAALVGWALAWAGPLSFAAMSLVEGLCRLIGFSVHVLGSLPFAAVEVPSFSAWWIPVWYLAMLGLWRKHVRPP